VTDAQSAEEVLVDVREDDKLPETSELPFSFMIGHLEGVPTKQALAYARGLGLKMVKEESLGYFGVVRTPSGVVFEIHEGGRGRALLPAILDHVKEWGPYEQGERHFLDVPTLTRTVRVVRTANGGLTSVQLSEGVPPASVVRLSPGKPLRPLVDDGSTFVNVGKALFAAGVVQCAATLAFMVVSAAQAVRAQAPAAPGPAAVPEQYLPSFGFQTMLDRGHREGVHTLRLRSGTWSVQTDNGNVDLISIANAAQPQESRR